MTRIRMEPGVITCNYSDDTPYPQTSAVAGCPHDQCPWWNQTHPRPAQRPFVREKPPNRLARGGRSRQTLAHSSHVSGNGEGDEGDHPAVAGTTSAVADNHKFFMARLEHHPGSPATGGGILAKPQHRAPLSQITIGFNGRGATILATPQRLGGGILAKDQHRAPLSQGAKPGVIKKK